MHIPEDVARLVFENSAVDGCVALSQTCQSFRAAFLELDALLEAKVKECAPWMDRKETWGQSALLCSARNRLANSDSWMRAPSQEVFSKTNYTCKEPKKVEVRLNPSREQLQSYKGAFGDVRLPFLYRRTIVKHGIVYMRDREDIAYNLDYCPYALNLTSMAVVETQAKEDPPVVQLLDFGSESRDRFVSPVSGIAVISDTATDTGNRYPDGVVFVEDIMFIDENEMVMIVAKRCIASMRHEAFYVYKPDADIVDNTLKFNHNDWKRTAMDPLMPPQLIKGSSWIAVVKNIAESKWACLEHAQKSNDDLIQLMKLDSRLFSVQVYDGLLYVYRGNKLYPIWVNLNEKRKLLFNYLHADEKEQYTVSEVKPALKKGWKAIGGWKGSRAVPWFAKADKFITRGDFRRGGGYVVGNLETGQCFKVDSQYKKGKPEFVFPSLKDDKVDFYSISRIVGRKLLTELHNINESKNVDCQKETARIQKLYDELVENPGSDSEDEDDEDFSDENSDNERRIEMLSRPVVLPDDMDDFSDDSFSDNAWARATLAGDIDVNRFMPYDDDSDGDWARNTLGGNIPYRMPDGSYVFYE
ncbi:hypothetical protein CJU89_6802 [Yarrowia sp. B02]|nr:hypothetical protein CJU89_6802 [Yarrowia sp. B02]